jgi:hypothetical protein
MAMILGILFILTNLSNKMILRTPNESGDLLRSAGGLHLKVPQMLQELSLRFAVINCYFAGDTDLICEDLRFSICVNLREIKNSVTGHTVLFSSLWPLCSPLFSVALCAPLRKFVTVFASFAVKGFSYS